MMKTVNNKSTSVHIQFQSLESLGGPSWLSRTVGVAGNERRSGVDAQVPVNTRREQGSYHYLKTAEVVELDL
jgi:hypothetical protein